MRCLRKQLLQIIRDHGAGAEACLRQLRVRPPRARAAVRALRSAHHRAWCGRQGRDFLLRELRASRWQHAFAGSCLRRVTNFEAERVSRKRERTADLRTVRRHLRWGALLTQVRECKRRDAPSQVRSKHESARKTPPPQARFYFRARPGSRSKLTFAFTRYCLILPPSTEASNSLI